MSGLAPDLAPAEEEGSSVLPVVAGGAAALGGLALLAKMPGKAGQLFKMLNAIRQQSMLSGLALPKSILGGIGAGVEAAAKARGLSANAWARQALIDAATKAP